MGGGFPLAREPVHSIKEQSLARTAVIGIRGR